MSSSSSSFLQQAFSQTRKEIELLDRHLTALRLKIVDLKIIVDKLVAAESSRTGQTPQEFADAAFEDTVAKMKRGAAPESTTKEPSDAV